MLCGKCEDLFNTRWDDFGIETYRKLVARIERVDRGSVIELANVDHPRFRLFQLSILWRASVAKHPAFAAVQLGPHEEKIRSILDREDYAAAGAYPCFIMGFVPTTHGYGVVASPTMRRHGGHSVFEFVLPRMRWAFVVSSHVSKRIYGPLNIVSQIHVMVAARSEEDFNLEVFMAVHKKRVAMRRSQSNR